MKKLFFLLLGFTSIQAKASESYMMMPYSLLYDSLDTSLDENESMFLFDLSVLDHELRDELVYSVDDGENIVYNYSLGDIISVPTKPGKHTFQFYAGSEYMETSKFQLTIDPQHRQLYRINFSRAYKFDAVRKPVIYLYPEKETEVKIEVNPVGEFTFTYPSMENGWEFTCHPDGSIHRGDESYRYLFWESEQDIPSQILPKNEGAIVSGSEAVAYLEMQMKKFGMTSEERADFITYWGPILQTKSNLYIYLLFNEVCDAVATLDISPKPAEIGRFYVIWASVPDDYNPSLESQEVPVMQRDGFTVLEWGGAEVNAFKILLEDL